MAEYEAQLRARAAAEADAATDGTRASGGTTDPVQPPPAVTPELAAGPAADQDAAEDDTPESGGSLSCNVCLSVHNGLVWSSYRVM